jgi:hypothetical protein
MKNKVFKVDGCKTCPFSVWKDDGYGWLCSNFSKKLKHIDVNFIDNRYPDWCPLKKNSLILELNK